MLSWAHLDEVRIEAEALTELKHPCTEFSMTTRMEPQVFVLYSRQLKSLNLTGAQNLTELQIRLDTPGAKLTLPHTHHGLDVSLTLSVPCAAADTALLLGPAS